MRHLVLQWNNVENLPVLCQCWVSTSTFTVVCPMYWLSTGCRGKTTVDLPVYTNVGRIKLRYVNLKNSYDVT